MNKTFILMSYPYFTKEVYETFKGRDPKSYELIIDSGAFTVFKSGDGKTIDLNQYHKFLDSISHLPILKAIQLDVMGDGKKSWENFLKSKECGYDVAPVFTRGTDIKEIEKMYKYSDLVFIGATKGVGGPNYIKYVLENNKNRKVHLLGTLNTNILKHYKPYSCDVSSWMATARYGVINIYKAGGDLYQIHKREFVRKPKPEILKQLYKLGLTPKEISYLGKKEAWVFKEYGGKTDRIHNCSSTGVITEKDLSSVAQFISTISWVYRQNIIYKKLGTKFFLACGKGLRPDIIFNARKFLIERGVI